MEARKSQVPVLECREHPVPERLVRECRERPAPGCPALACLDKAL